jgi:hypothetical protein
VGVLYLFQLKGAPCTTRFWRYHPCASVSSPAIADALPRTVQRTQQRERYRVKEARKRSQMKWRLKLEHSEARRSSWGFP